MAEHKILIIVAGKENTSAIFKKVGASIDGLGKATDGLGKASSGLGKTFGGIGKNAKGLGKSIDGLGKSVKKPVKEFPPLTKATGRLGKAFGNAGKATSGLRGDLAKLVGGAALLGIAKMSISASLSADRYRTSLEGLAGGAKEATGFIEGIQGASLGTISKMDAMAISSKALSLKVVDNAQSMKDLTEVAITLGRAQGLSATQAVDDLTTAIGRQSPLILDNLGITLKASEAKEIYAASLNKTVGELTAVEASQAFANAALIKGQEVAAKLGGVQEDSAAKSERLTAQLSDLSIVVGDGLVPAFSGLLDIATPVVAIFGSMQGDTITLAAGLGVVTVSVFKLTGGMKALKAASLGTKASVGLLGVALVGLIAVTDRYNKKAAKTAVAAGDAQQAAGSLGSQVDDLVASGSSLNDALAEMAPGVDKSAKAWDDLNPAVKLFADVSGNSEKFVNTMTTAQDSLNQSIVGNVSGFGEYKTAVAGFNANVTEGKAKITAFTEAQFNMAQIMEKGASAASLQADAIFTQGIEVEKTAFSWDNLTEGSVAHAAATNALKLETERETAARELSLQATMDQREEMENSVGTVNRLMASTDRMASTSTRAGGAVVDLTAQLETSTGIREKAARVAGMQAASMVAANAALEAKRQKNIATAETEVGLASSMVDVTEAALAQTFIQGLDAESMGLTAYQAAVENIQLSFGLATPESIALSRGITQGLEAANSGALAYKDLDQFIVALKADAADGAVDFDALSRTFASSTAQADFLGQRITATGDAIVGNVAKTEALIAAEEGLTGVTQQAKDQMAGFGDILPNIASGGELWTNTIDGSSRALVAGQATAMQWESTMAGLDARMMTTGESLLNTGEKIEAVNAVFEEGARPIEDSTQGLDNVGEAHAAARVPVEEFAGAVGEIPAGMDAAANAAPPAAEGVVDFGVAAGEAVDPVARLADAANSLSDAMSGIPAVSVPTTGGGGGTNGAESFAGGGVVPGNSHQAVPIIAHGRERVVPEGQSVGPTGAPTAGNSTTNFNRAGDTVILQGAGSVNTFMRMRQREDRLARHAARM